MPYRALTHNRVNSYANTVAQTQSQESAINSQNGVSNSGSVTSQRNKLNISNKQSKRAYYRTMLSRNSKLIEPNAFGDKSTYVTGQGKGFPNATPQVSVGSTNAFARRAIARRAVTNREGASTSKNCPCNTQIKNLKGQVIKPN